MNFKYANSRAFSLVEIIVAIAIFVVLMMISVGAITGIFDANRKSQSLKSIMTNLNFAVEVMAREIRFGKIYHCGSSGDIETPQDCSNGGTFISFLSSDDEQIVYRQNGSTLEKSIDGGSDYLAITAGDVVIQSAKFYVVGAELPLKQPKVVIVIRGYAGTKPITQSSFTIQTTVSQRSLDT